MNLKSISDEKLLAATEKLVSEERRLLTALLHHLREIERRRLYSDLKFTSLFQYAVEKLGYPEDQAMRRISAMRLLKELPEIEEKINSGALSLTCVGMARTLFRKEEKANRKFSKQNKLELLKVLEHKSVREASKVIASISPEFAGPDKIRTLSDGRIEIRCSTSAAVQEKLDRLMGMLAHSEPDISLGELLDRLCDLALITWDKSAAPRAASRKMNSMAERRRELWSRNKRCSNCGSTYALEIDHRLPKSLGGGSEPQNLRVLCRNCNQRAAIGIFGIKKMDNYLEGGTPDSGGSGGDG